MTMHVSHHDEMRRAVLTILILTALLLAAVFLPAFDFSHGLIRYLPLHIVLEVASITVAVMVFSIGWSAGQQQDFSHVYWLSAVFLGVAVLDTFHMLSFQGMPDMLTPAEPQKAINFWLAARFLTASGLLVCALFPDLSRPPLSRHALLGLVLLFTAGCSVWFLGFPETVPETFVPDRGLTAFKIALEYILIAIYLLTAVLLLRSMRRPRHFHAAGLFAAAVIMAMSEFLFTLYGDVSDLYNLLGHVYKVVAYLFLYRALFVETVQQPYRQLQASEQQLRQQQEELDYFFEANLDLFCIGDAPGRFVRLNSSWERVLGYRRAALEGRFLSEFVYPDDQDVTQEWVDRVAQGDQLITFQNRLVCADGALRYLEWRAVARAGVVYASARDITERRQQEAQIRRLSSVVDQNPSPILITDLEGHIEYVNAAFTRLSGYTGAEVLGRNPSLLKSGKTPPETYQTMWKRLLSGRSWQGELVNRNKQGELYIESALIYPLRDEHDRVVNFIAHKEDITARREAEQRIEQLSHYDQLTGLPNRDLLQRRFSHALDRAMHQHSPVALIWLDLDNFKAINDTLGHSMGDLVLREIALRLRTVTTGQDTLARQSGDSFILLLPGQDQDQAALLAEQVLELIQQPLLLTEDKQELTISASLGLALYPSDGDQFELLTACAEAAMYRAKQEGRNNFRFYAPEMQAHSLRKLALTSALSHALSRGELWLAYQPQYDLHQQQMTGAEVLLRWDNPQWGSVSPAEFIPLAENNGLIVTIGEWVLQQAASQLKQWQEQGLPAMTLAINLSALQFVQPDLARNTAAIVTAAGLEPARFELELTEAVALNNPEDAQRIMAELRSTGFRLSIDDFGTGYSSMSYLKRFAVDKLKIDQSFIRELEDSKVDEGIVTAIIQLAHSLGMEVIAEGVETYRQLGFLGSRGCDAIQGYYFSRPLPAAEFEAFWRREYQPPSVPVQDSHS